MRRVRLHSLGLDQPLTLESALPIPTPTGDQLLLEVDATGVCHRDIIDRTGGAPFIRLPITLGHEVAGRVIAAGPDARRFRPGDRVATLHRDACNQPDCTACTLGETSLCERAMHVFGILADGGYASHLLAPESALYPIPAGVPADEAAILHCTFGTAYRGLRAAGCGPGKRALIVGAAGGVGSAALEVATRMGARAVAVVRDPRHREHCLALGADRVVVAPDNAFHKHSDAVGADLALDCVGQPTLDATLRSLCLGGTAIAIGNLVRERLPLNIGLVIVKALRLIGSSGATARDMAELLTLRGARPFATPRRSLTLEQADQAHHELRTPGAVQGRLVLRPGAAG